MGKLKLTLACGLYDRTRALQNGEVRPEGIELNYLAYEPFQLFWRQARYAEFDASEYSLGAYLTELGKGMDRFVGIPVFPSRAFRHSCVYVNTEAGIEKAEDLKGKRIGLPDFSLTAIIWLRGILADDYGIGNEDAIWYTGGLNKPGGEPRMTLNLPEGMERYHVRDRSLNDMLVEGELDALLAPLMPVSFLNRSPRVARLWPNYAEVEKDYFSRTGLFPIMHAVVIKRNIYEKHPWVARNLMQAFIEAKEIAQQELYGLSVLKTTLPWQFPAYEETVRIMGPDYWPYGMEANRKGFETLARYMYEQGITPRIVKMEEAFVESTWG